MSDVAATPSPVSQVKIPMMPLLLVCLVGALLSAAACVSGVLYLSHAGKLGGSASPQKVEVIEKPAEPTHNVALEPMLVNLADEDGHSYLRLGVVLAEEDDPAAKKGEKEGKPTPGADASVRDTVLGVLGRKHVADLLAPEGKEKLKAELKTALRDKAPEARVREVYFTEFLVQR